MQKSGHNARLIIPPASIHDWSLCISTERGDVSQILDTSNTSHPKHQPITWWLSLGAYHLVRITWWLSLGGYHWVLHYPQPQPG